MVGFSRARKAVTRVQDKRGYLRLWSTALQMLLGGGALVLVLLAGSPWSLATMLGVVVLCGLGASLFGGGRGPAREVTMQARLGETPSPTGSGQAAGELPGSVDTPVDNEPAGVGRWALKASGQGKVFPAALRVLASLASVFYCVSAAWAWETFDFWDPYFALVAWLVSGSHVAAWCSSNCAPRFRWLHGLAWVWGLLGSMVWAGAAYAQDRPVAFHVGWLLLFGVFIWLRLGFRLSGFEIQAANGVLLMLVALPVADWLMHSSGPNPAAMAVDRPYSFSAARKDPARFAAWWRQYQSAWDELGRDVFIPDPAGKLPLRLRPDSQGHLIESRIRVNSLGFRGRDMTLDKAEAYRIVAVGESTTFGCTLEAEDRPWPEWIEEWIRERWRPARAVEVINAGVPAYTLADSLERFEGELLPLEPDLVLVYHGYNGFPMLRTAVPPPITGIPPAYTRRPSTLLAKLEFRLESMLYDRRMRTAPEPKPVSEADLLETEYAEHYERLIELTRRRGLRLVLCTFSMAVNGRSAREVIEFYRPGFPSVHWQIVANEAHSELLRALARRHPDIGLVETGPGLDGHHELFIDLVHLTESGRRQLAENIFAGLRRLEVLGLDR